MRFYSPVLLLISSLLGEAGRAADKIDFSAQIRPILSLQEFYQTYTIFNQSADLDTGAESPTHPVPNPAERERATKLAQEIATLQRQIDSGTPEMALEQAKWEAEVQREVPWQPVTLTNFQATGKPAWEKQPNNVILVRPGAPPKATYELQTSTPLHRITAVRLEAMPDEALPNRGPGHALSGNAVVSELTLSAHPTVVTPPSARFVRVEAPGKGRFLHLAEIEVMSQGKNVAREGKATQISTDYGGDAPRGIDGNTNGDYKANSTTHTAATDNPWWEVDLGKEFPIEQIVLWNRMDGDTPSRLSPFKISALNAERHTVWQQDSKEVPKPKFTASLADYRPAVAFTNPSATFSQAGWEVAKAVDGDPKTGWAFAPRCGETHSAIFQLADPLDFKAEGAIQLDFRIAQEFGENHTLGKFRLSVTDAAPPFLALSPGLKAILAKPPEARTDADKAQVTSFFRPHSKVQRELVDAKTEKQKELDNIKPIAVPVLQELPIAEQRNPLFLDPSPDLSRTFATKP